ncbi:MAG: hypothetical protein RR364_04710 [Lachnospiraceae bacterium]
MKIEDFFSWRRVRLLVGMFVLTLLCIIVMGMIHTIMPDRILAFLFAGIIFFLFYVYGLEYNRIQKGVLDEISNNFNRIACFYSISMGILIICELLPLPLNPIVIVAVVMTIVTNQFLGMTVSIFISIIMIYVTDGSVNTFCSLLILAIGGVHIAENLMNKKNWPKAGLTILTGFLCIPGIFSFLETYTMERTTFITSFISAIGTILVIFLLIPFAIKGRGVRKINTYPTIISSDYPLVQDLMNYSKEEYQRAKRISNLSYECAKAANCNTEVCRAAGFYYRIGLLEDEPHIENAVKLAQKNYFPNDVIQIISEYNGERNQISTPESAIVHICTVLTMEIQNFNKEEFSVNWNKEVTIHKIMNQLSESGIYDYSGLGMNMFIRIREYIIKEAALYDNHNNK